MAHQHALTVNLGCRLNASETETMASLAEANGEAPIIVNTCAVTNEAVRQSRQAIRRAAKTHPGRDLVVTGCAAELDPQAFEAMPEVARRVPNALKTDPASWRLVENPPVVSPSPPARPLDVRAPLAVQTGCDHRCTFCIIPFGRGEARSLPIPQACEAAQALVDRGAEEIVLTGVDLTSWGPDLGEGLSLGHLVEGLHSVLPDRITIRLSSIDGAEIDARLFDLLTGVPRIAPYAHLSLQAGDDLILKRMKRRHSRADAIELCWRLRDARPAMAFGADLIAGFPTETDAMFEATLGLIEACQLSYVHVFPFSPRQGTPAAKMPPVERSVVKARANRLRAEADRALTRHLTARMGQRTTVLIEEIKEGIPRGRMDDFTDVHVPGAAGLQPGQRVRAHLTTMNARHLTARVLTDDHSEETSHGG